MPSSIKDRGGSAPVNWLASLDGWAQTWPPARSWLHPYDFFVLTRYPQLQPGEDSRPKSNFASGKETYEQHLAAQLERVGDCNQRILRRLTPEHRKELAALVFELSLHFEEHRQYASTVTKLREEIENLKRLELKVNQARDVILSAIQEVHKLASKLNDPVGSDILAAASRMKVRASRQERESWMDTLIGNNYFQLFASDASTLAMVQLYWLFRHGFGFEAGESELRVALIRNCEWKNLVKPVRCVSRNLGDQSIGCDAVRKAVRRFRLPQGTTP